MTAFKDAFKSFLLVWVFGTLGLFIPGMLGWIHEVSVWAAQGGAPAFPDPSNLAYLFVAAITAAFPAALAFIVRFIENLSGKRLLPRTHSVPVGKAGDPGAAGAVDTRTIAVAALVLAVVIVLILVF